MKSVIERIRDNLTWFKSNIESDHTSNLSDGYKDGLIFALQEYLKIDQNISQVIKTPEWVRGYNDGQRSIDDEINKR
jgi:hypothetical protein